MLPEQKKQIVIAGAGFAGVRAALDLAKNPNNFDITIIDSKPYHCFHADLYEVGSAILTTETKKDFRSLEGSVSIPLTTIFKNKKVKIVVDIITDVDLPSKKILTESKKELSFDYLILGLGSTTNYFGIEGAQEFSHPFKNSDDALNVRDDLEELISRSENAVHLVIAGGGFTGVELSAELAGYTHKLAKIYQRRVPKITIIEASPTILPGMPSWAQTAANEQLTKLGIDLLLNQPISKVTSHEILSEDKEPVGYDYLIWTTGVRGASLDGKIKGVEITKRGKIVTEPDLSLKDFPFVFVIGDLAECIDPKRNCPLEATAWMGIEEGKMTALNLSARLKGKETENFSSPAPVFIVPIGKKYALADLGFIKLKGSPAWVLKRLVTLKYLMSITTFWFALTVWLKGVKIYNRND